MSIENPTKCGRIADRCAKFGTKPKLLGLAPSEAELLVVIVNVGVRSHVDFPLTINQTVCRKMLFMKP